MKKRTNTLRLLRIILATVFFAGITLLILDFTGVLRLYLGWMAKIQFLPAILAVNIGVVAAILVITLLFGRIYCSTVCPLGVYQDAVSSLAPKKRFSFRKNHKWLRLSVLVVMALLLVTGLAAFAAYLAPYGIWARFAGSALQPLYILVNNLFAAISARFESYAFYSADVWLKSLPALIISVATIILITVLAWKNGRVWCGNICPVGTALGIFAKHSLFKPVIDTEKCVNCGLCGKKCKASCIDTENHEIDYSRCVDCFDCIDNCGVKAISYRFAPGKTSKDSAEKGPDESRRAFLATAVLAAGAATIEAKAQEVDGGLAEIQDKTSPKRETPLKPAGSKSLRNFTSKCISCGLCISECPNGVLRPSTSLRTFLQPEMDYERGYCRPECTLCSEVCPTGAITKITKEEKSSIQIGHAVWIEENCLPLTDGVNCGNCARHCPVGAIKLVRIGDTPLADKYFFTDGMIPVVNEDRCIGCGACENLCPSRPVSAIYVEGHEVHKEN